MAYTPKNLAEALRLLHKEPGTWTPLAGGTDLMVVFEAGHLQHKNLLNIFSLRELRGIKITKSHVTLGALNTFAELQTHSILQKEFPNLCAAGRVTGAIAIQNRATLGGNIMNASPAADSPPALLSYDAELEIVSHNKEPRWQTLSDFYIGYKKMRFAPEELVKSVRLPRRAQKHFYRKVGTRRAQAISKVVMAATLQLGRKKSVEEIRIAYGSIAPQTIRCEQIENFLQHKTIDQTLIEDAKVLLTKSIAPIDDIRSNAEYRTFVAPNLLEEFLQTCGTG